MDLENANILDDVCQQCVLAGMFSGLLSGDESCLEAEALVCWIA